MPPTPPPTGSEPLIAWCKSMLERYARDVESDPQTNSVRRLAIDLFRALEADELAVDDIGAAVEDLGAAALAKRLEAFRGKHRLLGANDPWEEVAARLEALAEAGRAPFFEHLERVSAGVVFTAHPTFALSPDLRRRFAAAAVDPDAGLEDMAAAVREAGLVSAQGVTLQAEHDEVQDALSHARAALLQLWRLALGVAAQAFPDDWRTFKPVMVNLASWVGYDLDGRTDIHWGDTLALRLGEKATQLERYAAQLQEICEAGDPAGLGPHIETLAKGAASARAAAAAFGESPRDVDWLVACAEAIGATETPSLAPLIAELDAAALTAPDAVAQSVILLAAEMRAFGLGTARLHLRINAAQIRSVLAQDFPGEVAADESVEIGRSALAAIAARAQSPVCAAGGVADLFEERTTARRQFMLCRVLLSQIDADTPIRFLVAESENPATVMGALYLARQYGVDDKVDISPLFETPDALERGGRFVARLLKEPVFVDYLRARGRLCLQFGFSDSGRYAGQAGAEMAIERIHNLVGASLVEHGLQDLELVLFNTHGESMGRGAYPGNFQQRFDHLLSPFTRSQLKQWGVSVTHEFSFQGGDGYLHFANAELARSTLAESALHALAPADEPTDVDPFYAERDFTWDIYRTLRGWHERLFENSDYARAVLEFGPGMLVSSGSRRSRRQTGAAAGQAGLSSLRAIPQNAILQQLAVPLNVACGLGSSTAGDPDRFAALVDASPRMRHLVDLAIAARTVTSLPAFRGYAHLFDPSFWNAAAKRSDRHAALPYRALSEAFCDYEVYTAISKLADLLTLDLARFDRILPALADAPTAEQRRRERLELHCLHAMRQALMARALTLAASAPRASGRHDGAAAEDFIAMAAQLRLEDLAAKLAEVFPKGGAPDSRLEPFRDKDCDPEETRGYDDVHQNVIDPILRIKRRLDDASAAICCHYGAYG